MSVSTRNMHSLSLELWANDYGLTVIFVMNKLHLIMSSVSDKIDHVHGNVSPRMRPWNKGTLQELGQLITLIFCIVTFFTLMSFSSVKPLNGESYSQCLSSSELNGMINYLVMSIVCYTWSMVLAASPVSFLWLSGHFLQSPIQRRAALCWTTS